MEDTLGFSEQEKPPDDWHPEEESMSSLASKNYSHSQDLQVIEKKDFHLDRPIIQATFWERLSFYRSYATSQTKTQFLCMQQEDFKIYVWNYLLNVFFKSLPTTYVYAFFSAYVPDTHFFIAKILPIAYGSTIAFITTAFMELIMVTINTAKYVDYLVHAFFLKSPWNRCPYGFNFSYKDIPIACYEIDDFAKQFINQSVNFSHIVYVTQNNEHFQLPQILFFLMRRPYFQQCNNKFTCSYIVILWIGASLSYTLFFKRFLWKTLHITQMALNLILFLAFFHFIIIYFEKGFKKYALFGSELLELMQKSDFDLLSESMTAPPIIHILSSRSNIENKPIQDSALIITSNAIYYLFRGFVAFLLKLYCDDLTHTSLQVSYYSAESFFYLWPIYFGQFFLGDIYTIIFFFLNLIIEYLVVVITTHCLMEAILSEWRSLKAWMLIICFSLIGVAFFYFTSLIVIKTMYLLCTVVSTLMEVVIIFIFYPFGRLVDDMTFFNGERPTTLRIFTFWTAPVFYSLKFYFMISGFLEIVKMTKLPRDYKHYEQFLYFLALPICVGALYAVYKYIFIMKMDWIQLFKPLPNWGPKDFAQRQLRKKYDSRSYITSQASRDLSRYLIEKCELNEYKLDVGYDSLLRRPSPRTQFELEHEKKL